VPAGGEFAKTVHSDEVPQLETPPAAFEMAQLGKYSVSASALQAARGVWPAIERQPDWMRHMAAEAWATQRRLPFRMV